MDLHFPFVPGITDYKIGSLDDDGFRGEKGKVIPLFLTILSKCIFFVFQWKIHGVIRFLAADGLRHEKKKVPCRVFYL